MNGKRMEICYCCCIVAKLCLSDTFAIPWTAAHQGASQATILEWVAISFSRGTFMASVIFNLICLLYYYMFVYMSEMFHLKRCFKEC